MSCCSACGKHACACGCGARAGTPLPLYNRPGLTSLAYRVGTYADFRANMQADLSDAALPALAGLRTREADDPAIALLDAWAVGADVLSFYQERIANEGYLRTATERRSVLELARLVDYRLRPGVAASVYLAYTVEQASPPVTIAAGARAQSIPAPGEQMQTFETAEPLDARHEWNALQPRLTRPLVITRGSLDTLAGLGFKGAANNLKTNDWLVFEFADGKAPAVRQIQQVNVDMKQQRTIVTLQGSASVAARATDRATAMKPPSAATQTNTVPPSRFQTLVDALLRPPTAQPANATRLSRNVSTALGTASDVRPQLLLNFEQGIANTFYAAWSASPVPDSLSQVSNIYVQRLTAARFGYNAPLPTEVVGDGHGVYHSKPRTDDLDLSGDDKNPDLLFLDNAYDGIRPDTYVIVYTPQMQEEPHVEAKQLRPRIEVRKVKSAAIHPRTAYGISGKTTELTLEYDTTGASTEQAKVASEQTNPPITRTVRVQQVFAQSEHLTLAEQAIDDAVGTVSVNNHTPRLTQDDATHLTLDSAVDGLKPGRWVIVQGQRADVPGTDAVNAAELVMIAAVEQGADANLPGDTVHSTLVFANDGLAYAYRRDTVTVCANVVRATHGETRNEVLGSGSGATAMQAFVLKQSPLTYVSAATVDGVQSTLTVRVNGMQWHETRNLAFVGATDRSFATAIDDAGKTTVQFGDGSHGARLPTGVENVVANYRNGIGTPGNVNAQQISLLATKPLGVKAVVNPLRASGGADAETRDQARGNVPLAVLALDRLVSITDYADFARSFGGVGKATSVKLGNRVQVTIAGAADAPIDASSDLYRNLLQALQRYGDPGLPVQLNVRELLALTLSAKVGLAPDYAWESVEPQLRAALLDRFGFERRALAQNAYLSEVVACLQAVRGVAWVDVDAFDQADKQRILDGLGGGNGKGDGNGKGSELTLSHRTIGQQAWPALRPYVQALPARFDSDGISVLPAQLACLLPDVPDTLLLQEATP